MDQTGPADGSLSLGKVRARAVHPSGLAGMARFWALLAAAGGSQAAEAVTTGAPAVAGGVRFRQSGGPIERVHDKDGAFRPPSRWYSGGVSVVEHAVDQPGDGPHSCRVTRTPVPVHVRHGAEPAQPPDRVLDH